MGLQFDSHTFSGLHGAINHGPWGNQREDVAFNGVAGIAQVFGPRTSRELTIEYWLYNYASFTALRNEIETMATFQNVNGQLTITGPAATTPYNDITFVGFSPTDTEQYDASGSFAWNQRGVLRFIQTRPIT